TGPPRAYPAIGRIEGFRDAFTRNDIPVPELLIRAQSFSNEFAFTETTRLCSSPERPTAIVIGGMAMLAGAIRGLRSCGLRIGGDISLIAGSESDRAELASPPITAISWDFEALGRFCAETLVARMKHDDQGERKILILPTSVVLRSSCAPVTQQNYTASGLE